MFYITPTDSEDDPIITVTYIGDELVTPSGEWAAVDFGEPIEDNFIVLDGRGFLIRTAHADQVFSISGDAEAVSMADMNWVAVYGDCSISVTGAK